MITFIENLPADSAFRRAVLGPAADLSIDTYLLRQVAYSLAGANWQRGGGKGRRPEPITLPGEKPRKQAKAQGVSGDDVAARLRRLGLIPAAPGQSPQSAAEQAERVPSAAEFERAVDDEFLAREMRLAADS